MKATEWFDEYFEGIVSGYEGMTASNKVVVLMRNLDRIKSALYGK